jgi:hypothetical protein
MASSVWGLVGFCGIEVDEIVEVRLPAPEAFVMADGWWRSIKRTFVPVMKQLMCEFVGA